MSIQNQDLYANHGDVIADALLSDSALFDPVEPEFAEASDTGYGEWSESASDEYDQGALEHGAGEAPAGDRYNRELSDQEQADLDELGRMMSSTDQPLLDPSGRGTYVNPGADDSDLPPGDVALEGGETPPDSPADHAAELSPDSPRRWPDLSRRSHRVIGIGAAGAAIALVAALTLGGTDGDNPADTSTAGSPDFSVPTVTQSPAAPSTSAAASADGPIGIKRADSRCTAGSTDPKQAFDLDLNTAWMCVPAYGVPGTVLRVEFDNWYVVTGVSLVPGWNRINPDGSDEWVKHKTAATVEYQFNDPDETRLTQQTNSIRDEVFTALQPPVLASAMTITITEFGSPTGAVADVTNSPAQGGIIASDTPVTGDLKDFAISSISIIGHRAN